MSNIIPAAKALLPELPKLLPPDTAQEYDKTIRDLLSQIETNQAQPTQLTAFLRQSNITRQWINRFNEGENPSEITRSINLPGNGAATDSSLKYQCQQCGKSLTSPQKGRIPKCKDHPEAQVIEV
jgi:hypothetical protein